MYARYDPMVNRILHALSLVSGKIQSKELPYLWHERGQVERVSLRFNSSTVRSSDQFSKFKQCYPQQAAHSIPNTV